MGRLVYERLAIGIGTLSVDEPRMLAAVLKALFGCYEQNLQQEQAEAQSAHNQVCVADEAMAEPDVPR